jgi:hypothetical protein|tara:strand:- start:2373 stop:2762 length:390 start_codon:yes stop_codon:yes gene_type:complete
MSDFSDALEGLVPIVGAQAVKLASDELDGLASDASDPLKAAVLSLMSDAVAEHGTDGIAMAQKAVKDLLDGDTPNINWASPRTASNLVAAMQNAEADRKTEAREMAQRIGHALGKIGAVLIKAAIASAV